VTVSYIAIEENRKEDLVTLDYRAVLTTNDTSAGVVWIPVSANTQMQDALLVTKGQGTLDLVQTEHGLALRIEYEGNLTVRGSLEAYEYFENWELTLKSEEWDERIWAGHEPGIEAPGEVAIEVEVWRDSLYSGVGEDLDTSLVDGWEYYPFEYWEYDS
jgi:small nuclear ribonucleoprotein (snRNP)-like protein